jgi:hypothetical protein
MAKAKSKPQINNTQTNDLMGKLKERFHKNPERHKEIQWSDVEKRLLSNPSALHALHNMESTGGEPDVVGFDKKTNEYIFFDCSVETPAGRRSLCFDRNAWEARKENKPTGNVMDMAADMGAELLTEDDYRVLQLLGKFDLKTSSWILTPEKIRKLDGALFCDRRYDTVFVYHNGAQSYYGARGFRCKLRF